MKSSNLKRMNSKRALILIITLSVVVFIMGIWKISISYYIDGLFNVLIGSIFFILAVIELDHKPKVPKEYKGWVIDRSEYGIGYYEATNLNDCDAGMLFADSIEKLKAEIDEYN
jgi:hypothetical protein